MPRRTPITTDIPATAQRVADNSVDAYSAPRYQNWTEVAKVLLEAGYTPRQAEAIMRSKLTRWAADMNDADYGRVPATAITDYLTRTFRSDAARKREVRELVAGYDDLHSY